MFISGPSPCSGGVQAESWGYCSSIYVHRVLASDLQHDVTDAEATKSVVRKAVKQFGRLDVAFAKAGISWRSAPATLRNYDEDEFERICAADLNPQPTSVCRDGQQPADSVEKVAPLSGLRQNLYIGQQGSTQHDGTVIEWAGTAVLLVQP